MNLLNFLQRKLSTVPDIQPWDVKLDITKIDDVQRCANMTDSGAPGGSSIPDQLMYPFIRKKKKVKK